MQRSRLRERDLDRVIDKLLGVVASMQRSRLRERDSVNPFQEGPGFLLQCSARDSASEIIEGARNERAAAIASMQRSRLRERDFKAIRDLRAQSSASMQRSRLRERDSAPLA